MGRKSRDKGKVGEREAAELFREYGFEARRGQQFAGGGDSPDVISGVDGLHVEVKRAERFDLEAAMAQARDDAGDGALPVVFHRKSRRPWVAVVDAEVFLKLLCKIDELAQEWNQTVDDMLKEIVRERKND